MKYGPELPPPNEARPPGSGQRRELISLYRSTGFARILLLDEEPVLRDAIKATFQELFNDYIMIECGNGDDALHEWERVTPDLLITNYSLPGLTGDNMFQALAGRTFKFPIIVVSAHVAKVPQLQKQLLSYPGLKVGILNKPFLVEDLRIQVLKMLQAPGLNARDWNMERLPLTTRTQR